MGTWFYSAACWTHGLSKCDCGAVPKYSSWLLFSDTGDWLGWVESFERDGGGQPRPPFYGSTSIGRTGAVSTLADCQAMVERMVEGMR